MFKNTADTIKSVSNQTFRKKKRKEMSLSKFNMPAVLKFLTPNHYASMKICDFVRIDS